MQNLKNGQTYSTDNIARLLKGEYGPFMAVQGGQPFIGLSEEGHSITLLSPVGPRIPTLNVGTTAEPWLVTPIDLAEFTRLEGGGSRQGQVERRS